MTRLDTGVDASKNVSQFVLIAACAPVDDELPDVGVVADEAAVAGPGGADELELLPHAVATAASAQAATICATCR
jgi:hypothetical protein